MASNNERIYFPGLNALRFYAAFAVVFQHIGWFKKYHFGMTYDPGPFLWLELATPSARDCVTLFFVLSGFLITYLLLAEREKTGTVAVRKFYARRFLRIWPLYYLIVALGFFAMPLLFGAARVPLSEDGSYYTVHLLLALLFLPNVALVILPINFITPLGHLWSIGVEEQFYLMWPLLMKRVRRVPVLLGAIIVGKIALLLLFDLIHQQTGSALAGDVYLFLYNLRLESMALGGVGAYLVFYQKRRWLNLVYSLPVRVVIVVVWIAHLMVFDSENAWGGLALSALYLLTILNVTTGARVLAWLDHPMLVTLGKVSYGIYMLHSLVVFAVLTIAVQIGFTSITQPLWFNLTLYPLVILLTIGLALLSYRFFEQPFLTLKTRFTVVRSADQPLDVPQKTPV